MLCQGSQVPFPQDPALYLLWPCPPGSPGLCDPTEHLSLMVALLGACSGSCPVLGACRENTLLALGAAAGEPAEAAGDTWPCSC